jgi:hypothetical protein
MMRTRHQRRGLRGESENGLRVWLCEAATDLCGVSNQFTCVDVPSRCRERRGGTVAKGDQQTRKRNLRDVGVMGLRTGGEANGPGTPFVGGSISAINHHALRHNHEMTPRMPVCRNRQWLQDTDTLEREGITTECRGFQCVQRERGHVPWMPRPPRTFDSSAVLLVNRRCIRDDSDEIECRLAIVQRVTTPPCVRLASKFHEQVMQWHKCDPPELHTFLTQ